MLPQKTEYELLPTATISDDEGTVHPYQINHGHYPPFLDNKSGIERPSWLRHFSYVTLTLGILAILAILGTTPTISVLPSYLFQSNTVLSQHQSDQIPRVFTKEEQRFRQFRWGERVPHSSLERMVASLSAADLRTYEWLDKSRPITGAGTGVGLGASEPPEPIILGGATGVTAAGLDRGVPQELEGPGTFAQNSSSDQGKYNRLVMEWQTGRQDQVCPVESMQWMKNYAATHRKMMHGEGPPLIFTSCFLGITSTFIQALFSGRAFSISWDQPVPIDLIFDSASVDWSVPFVSHHEVENGEEKWIHPVYDENAMSGGPTDLFYYNYDRAGLPELLATQKAPWWTPSDRWIRMVFNRGTLLKLFTFDATATKVQDLGLTERNIYHCVLNYLLRPKADILKFVAKYTGLFSLPSVYAIGIQIRTGDRSMASDASDSQNTVEAFSHFFQCAEQVANTRALPGQKVVYYLTSDSDHLKEAALAAYPDKVITTGLGSYHLDKIDRAAPMEENLEKAMATVAGNYVMSGVDFSILTSFSGFGKIPTWMSGRPGHTIALNRKKSVVDCSSNKAIVSFTELAETWSGG